MERGEIWWAQNPPPSAGNGKHGRRMVVLLSWDAGTGIRDRVTVAPITTQIRGLDAEVSLDQNDGMARPCVANCDTLATVFYSTLEQRVTSLSDEKVRQLERAIHEALGIELPCTIR